MIKCSGSTSVTRWQSKSRALFKTNLFIYAEAKNPSSLKSIKKLLLAFIFASVKVDRVDADRR